MGKIVLLLDLDPQAHLTLSLSLKPENIRYPVSEVLLGNLSLVGASRETGTFGLDIVPANQSLSVVNKVLYRQAGYEFFLKQQIRALKDSLYDVILIDCPPAFGPLTLNALTAADLVVPSPFPTPSVSWQTVLSTPIPIPTPVPPVPVASDAINIVVLGSDQRPDWSEWHTDAIHIISVQTGRPAVSVISIPRDLYVYIPGFWMSRINFADSYGDAYDYPGGGTALLRDTLLYNLGIRADYFVRTNFDGLIGIVDTLGGIDVPVHCRLSDHWPYPDEIRRIPHPASRHRRVNPL